MLELQEKYDIKNPDFNPPMNWVTYHEDRLLRENSGKWDNFKALERYVEIKKAKERGK